MFKDVGGISPNGNVIFTGGMIQTGLTGKNTISIRISGCSDSGTVCIGSQFQNDYQSSLWTHDGGLFDLNAFFSSTRIQVGDVSRDGVILAGGNLDGRSGFRWNRITGAIDTIPTIDDRPYSNLNVNAISPSGEYVVGRNNANMLVGMTSEYEAFVWSQKNGSRGLGDFPGGDYYSEATGVSDNGVVVGYSYIEGAPMAFRWTEAEGMQPLGELTPGCGSIARDISADGRVIVGNSCPYGSYADEAAFIWTAEHGMQNLSEIAKNTYQINLNDRNGDFYYHKEWQLRDAVGVSDDGKTIIGNGYTPKEEYKSWTLRLDVPVESDLDNDGLTDDEEVALGLPIDNADSNNNFINDGLEYGNIIRSSLTYDNKELVGGRALSGKLIHNGRYTLFTSFADNVVPGDTNNSTDLFQRNNVTGEVIRLSTTETGAQLSKGMGPSPMYSVSDDGKFLLFTSNSPELEPFNSSVFYPYLYLKNLETGTIRLVTKSQDGRAIDLRHGGFNISADGQYVIFSSPENGFVEGDTNGFYDVFLFNTQTNVLERISKSFDGGELDGSTNVGKITSDGRYITMVSRAKNMVNRSVGGRSNIYLYDRVTKKTELITVSTDGSVSQNEIAEAGYHEITDDGNTLLFSYEGDLSDPANTHKKNRLYIRNRVDNTTTEILKSDAKYGGAKLFPDGKHIVYWTDENIGQDNNFKYDAYIWNRETQVTRAISINNNHELGLSDSWSPDISEDGQYVLISSRSRNLVPGDTNESTDLFIVRSGLQPPNTDPTIELTSPLNSDEFILGDDIQLSATVTDAEDDNTTLSNYVRWFINDVERAETGATITINDLVEGGYLVYAEVTDSQGATATSQEVAFSVLSNAAWSQDFTSNSFGLTALPDHYSVTNGVLNTTRLTDWRTQVFEVNGIRTYGFSERVTFVGELTAINSWYLSGELGFGIKNTTAVRSNMRYHSAFMENGRWYIRTNNVYGWDSIIELGAAELNVSYKIDVELHSGGSSIYVYPVGQSRGALYEHHQSYTDWGDVTLVLYSNQLGLDGYFDNIKEIVPDAIPNNPPSIDITSPISGSEYIQGEIVDVSATATDVEDDDALLSATIEWFVDGVLQAEKGASVSLVDLTHGTYQIGAQVTDSAGASVKSAEVTVVVNPAPNNPPMVNILLPVDGSEYFVGEAISFTAEAMDVEDDDTVLSSNIQWFLNGILRDEVGPSVVLSDLAPGSHSIVARVTDSAGDSVFSAAVSVIVTDQTGGTETILWSQNFNADSSGLSVLPDHVSVSSGSLSFNRMAGWQTTPFQIYGERNYFFSDQVTIRARVEVTGNWYSSGELGFGAMNSSSVRSGMRYHSAFIENGHWMVRTNTVYGYDYIIDLGAAETGVVYQLELVCHDTGTSLYIYPLGQNRGSLYEDHQNFTDWGDMNMYLYSNQLGLTGKFDNLEEVITVP